MFKALIFDFDGVIFNSEPIHFQACNTVLTAYGISIAYDEYLKKYAGVADRDMFPLIFSQNKQPINQNEIAQIIKLKIKAYENIIRASEDLRAIEGLEIFLDSLPQSIAKRAICSASTAQEIDVALAKLEKGDLRKYFPLIISVEDVTKVKPSPEAYLKTASSLDILPEHCLVIEDTAKGIKAAKAANMYVIGITTTQEAAALTEADYVANTYHEILDIITHLDFLS